MGKRFTAGIGRRKLKPFLHFVNLQFFALSQGIRKEKMSDLSTLGREPDWNGRRNRDKDKESGWKQRWCLGMREGESGNSNLRGKL